MKFLKYILLMAMLHGYPSCSMAQTTNKQLEFNSAWGVDYESNMVKNPSAAKNRSGTLFASGSLTRDTSAGNKIDNKASFQFDSSALNGYLELDLHTPSDEQTSGNCGFKGLFKGDARLYRAQILDGSSNVLAQTVPLTNETGFREFRVWYPCGAAGARKVRITQTEAGTAPAINVGKFYYGRMEPGAGVPPNTFTAKVSATGVLSDIVNPQYFNGTTFAPTDTSLFTISLKNLTSVPTCQVVGLQGTTDAPLVKIASQSASSIVVRTYTDSAGAGTKVAYAFNISCTKTGSDYIQPAITPDTPRFPTVRRFTSGSGTYTTPPGVKYLIVEMVGGGSGGSGSASTTANNGGIGGTGGTTTFGSSLLIATGGSGSGTYAGDGVGGVATVNSPAIPIVQLNGASGNAGVYNSSTTNPILFGSAGAATPLGGAGSQTEPLASGKNAVANTGSGGGGAAGNGSFPSVTGSGGSAGAYIKAQINSPSSTYAYAVGAGGTGGTAGTTGYAGGAGGSGVIIVTEYYGTENTPLLLNTVYADTAVKAEKAAGLTSVDYGTANITFTGGSNIASITSTQTCRYIRIGSIVEATCPITAACTAGSGNLTTATFTLPVSTTQGSTIKGVFGTIVPTPEQGWVTNSINNGAVAWRCGSTVSETRILKFSYEVP